jgi:hypothetical protein
VPGKVALDQPGLKVPRVFGEQLVAEVVGEPIAALPKSPSDLHPEGLDHR